MAPRSTARLSKRPGTFVLRIACSWAEREPNDLTVRSNGSRCVRTARTDRGGCSLRVSVTEPDCRLQPPTICEPAIDAAASTRTNHLFWTRLIKYDHLRGLFQAPRVVCQFAKADTV